MRSFIEIWTVFGFFFLMLEWDLDMEDRTVYPVLPLYGALDVDGLVLCFWTLKWILKFSGVLCQVQN